MIEKLLTKLRYKFTLMRCTMNYLEDCYLDYQIEETEKKLIANEEYRDKLKHRLADLMLLQPVLFGVDNSEPAFRIVEKKRSKK